MCVSWCLGLVFKRGIFFEVLPTVRQNQYKQTTSSRHLRDSLLLFTIVTMLSTSLGRAGVGREQPSAARLDWIGFMTWKPPLNVSIDTKPTCRATQRSGRVVRAEYLTQHTPGQRLSQCKKKYPSSFSTYFTPVVHTNDDPLCWNLKLWGNFDFFTFLF